jgi:hypothetical protein
MYDYDIMSSQPAPIPQKSFNPADVAITNPTGVAPVYANHATLFNGPHDIRIVFSEIVLDAPNADPKHELRASVAMSFTQAQQLLQALTQSLSLVKPVQIVPPATAKVH